jgi:DNA polymerase II small subunit
MKEKAKLIEEMFEKGVLVSEDFLVKEEHQEESNTIAVEDDLLVLNSDYADVIKQQTSLVDWYELDKQRVEVEKDRNDELYQNELQSLKKTSFVVNSPQKNQESQEISNLETELDSENLESSFVTETEKKQELESGNILKLMETQLTEEDNHANISQVNVTISYENKPFKYKVKDFANIFVSRYRFLENILRNRHELQGTMAINRVLDKKEKEAVSIIGIIEEVGETKTGHIILTLEDLTGKIKVLISKNNKDLFAEAKDLIPDEVIGIVGKSGDKIIFAEKIVWPDIPGNRETKKSEVDEYALFISDIHVGSNVFLAEEFGKFITWLKGEVGNQEQREMAKKIKYIFIAGDLVDGIGIYPSQEEELNINTIDGQYKEFCKYIKEIPVEKQIIICPGNHDMVHLAEPQPIFYKEYAPDLFEMPNVTLVTNPALINIGKTNDFSGFDVLMYHGYSFDYYVANVETIRNNGGYHRADLIMKFLLKRRHLAPAFKSTPYFPGHKEDPLLIKTIPDIFITGHIHYSKVANYKGVTMISGSCWQAKTAFQEKLGHEPEPGRVPVVNLKTRKIKILKFI